MTVDSIRDTIEDPDLITQDVGSDSIENYYVQGVIEDDPDSFLKVCVLFKNDGGRVITAFGLDRPYSKENILWQK